MVIYVWKYTDDRFRRIAVIDNATSVIWVKRFNDAGEFELYIRASAEMLELFDGEVILTRDDSTVTMSVENIHLDTDTENGDYLTISGRSAECLLGRRIIPKQTVFQTVSAENVIRELITQNILIPTDTRRKISIIRLGGMLGDTSTIDKQITGKNLLEAISDICKEQNLGFEMVFNIDAFNFRLYRGVDRSFNQSTNTPVIFSPEFENIGNTSYNRDKSTLYNSVYVAGEGEGKNRIIVNVGTSSGLARRELWVDARNESSDTDEGTLSPEMYAYMLAQQGREELTQTTETTEYSGEILTVNQYEYGTDYNLGDVVQIVNEYGISATATITEITEVEDETGHRIYPTLSEWSV